MQTWIRVLYSKTFCKQKKIIYIYVYDIVNMRGGKQEIVVLLGQFPWDRNLYNG